jgi:hypothetical protein
MVTTNVFPCLWKNLPHWQGVFFLPLDLGTDDDGLERGAEVGHPGDLSRRSAGRRLALDTGDEVIEQEADVGHGVQVETDLVDRLLSATRRR